VVTIIKKDGNISATDYLQTQKKLIDGLRFVYGKYKTYQVQINKIESFTGLDFGNLNKFDPMTNIKASSIIIGKASDIIYNYASKVKIS
jgi:endonuclease G